MLSCILDPLLQLCTVSASNLGTADMASYMVNSLYVMKTTLALFEFTDKRLEMLEFQVNQTIKSFSYILHTVMETWLRLRTSVEAKWNHDTKILYSMKFHVKYMNRPIVLFLFFS